MTNRIIAGVDEVGRGPLVGAVVTAAVVLDPANPIEGLADSKALSEKKRQLLFTEIKQKALSWSVGRCEPVEIDKLNILHATMLAMTRAVEGLSLQPDHVMVDGNRCPDWRYSSESVIKGDSKIAEISAASILAKVIRDQEMVELDKQFPDFGFARHKGYPTAYHMEKLEKFGPTLHHRMSFRPVRIALENHEGQLYER